MGQTAEEILIVLRAENADFKAKLSDAEKSLIKLGKQAKPLGSLQSALQGIGLAAKTFIAGIAAQAVGVFIQRAGELDTVTQSFNNLAASASGGANALLDAMRTASAGTVSNLDLMKASNNAIMLMGAEVTQYLPRMTEVARAAARSQGTSVSQMLSDIVVASGRQSVMILDNLGISSVVAGRHMEVFAARLGKTREQLTDTQKSAAFFYAVMQAGGAAIQNVGITTLTFGEQLQRLKAYADNTADTFAQALIPGLYNLVAGLSDVNNTAENSVSVLTRVGRAASTWMTIIGQIPNLAGTALANVGQRTIAPRVEEAIAEADAYSQRLQGIYGEMWRAVAPISELEELQRLTDAAHTLGAEYEELATRRARGLEEFGGAVGRLTEPDNRTTARPARTPGGVPQGARGGAARAAKNLSESAYLEYLGLEMRAAIAKETENTAELLAMDNLTAEQRLRIEERYHQRTKEIRQRYQLQLIQQIAEYTGKALEAELAAEELKRNALLANMELTAQQRLAIEEQYIRNLELITQRYDTIIATSREGIASSIDAGLSSFESATKALIMSGLKSWSDFRNSMKEILKQFVADLIWTSIKVLALRAVIGATLPGAGGAGGIGGIIASGLFVNGRVPSFERGNVPILRSGLIPSDHFPAFIGAREAVINAKSTKRYNDILQYINSNPNGSVQSPQGATQNIYFNGNVMNQDFVDRVVIPKLKDAARRQGTDLFRRQGI